MKKVIMVDFDGVLSVGDSWTEEECLRAEPIVDNIINFNRLAMENFMVVYTARRDKNIPASLFWLRKHGVMFHAITNNKPPADYYVDDKAFSLDEVIHQETNWLEGGQDEKQTSHHTD
jgi:hypothetical protein